MRAHAGVRCRVDRKQLLRGALDSMPDDRCDLRDLRCGRSLRSRARSASPGRSPSRPSDASSGPTGWRPRAASPAASHAASSRSRSGSSPSGRRRSTDSGVTSPRWMSPSPSPRCSTNPPPLLNLDRRTVGLADGPARLPTDAVDSTASTRPSILGVGSQPRWSRPGHEWIRRAPAGGGWEGRSLFDARGLPVRSRRTRPSESGPCGVDPARGAESSTDVIPRGPVPPRRPAKG